MGVYALDWRRYRQLRLTAALFWLGILPYAWLIQFLYQPRSPNTLHTSLIALYGIFWLIAVLRFEFFPCPRCGQAFATTWLCNRSFFAGKCVHCGLQKFDDPQ
ncbi:MAG: hypothetical protein WBD67_08385 [Terracidiphilus sp.]